MASSQVGGTRAGRRAVPIVATGIDQATLIDGILTAGDVAVFVGVDMSGWALDAAMLSTGK